MSGLVLHPQDVHNETLLSHVHPPTWENPKPSGKYNIVVLGAGTAGLITAAGSAGLGAKAALIEREWMGGDCLNVGCVPSKALLSAARVAAQVRQAAGFGVEIEGQVKVNFATVMERMRKLRAAISPNDSAQRYASLGVDMYFGQASFTGPQTVNVGGQTLHFDKAVIATGARAVKPDIPGLKEVEFLTNETVFNLTELPRRLAVLGGGPIGCELAQAFARFGSQVTLIEHNTHIMHREDREAVQIVERQMIEDGVHLLLNAQLQRAYQDGPDKVLELAHEGTTTQLRVDAILVGVGRAPNVEGLGLDEAGVEFDARQGVLVNDRLQTTNPHIYAAGDICSRFKFTHAADAMARIAIQNALFHGRAKFSALHIPWCTYTDPEIAHVGLYPHEAAQQNIPLQTFTQQLHHVDRAILDGQTQGFVKIHVAAGKDKILGATIVAAHAGDMLSEITLAMVGKLGLGTLAKTIHPYPTQAEAIKRAADAYNRTRLKPWVKAVFGRWFLWTRR